MKNTLYNTINVRKKKLDVGNESKGAVLTHLIKHVILGHEKGQIKRWWVNRNTENGYKNNFSTKFYIIGP